MAENKKPRTNWSDKARRITGVIAVAVVILVIVLSVSLGKGKSAPSQTVKVESAPTVVTESKPVVQESTEEVKTEEVEVKPEKVEIEAEPIIEIVEAEEVEAAAPEIEEAFEEAKVEETVETVPVVEETVEEPPVVEEVAPVEAETASFTLFGYTVENSWLDGVFTSTLKEKGIVSEDDVRGFALSEVDKYGEMLTSSATISFISDGFTLLYPETVDPADYIDVYKADLEAYITSLFASEEAPEVEEAPVEEAVEETVEEMDIETSDFDVFGYRILNSWYEGVFVSQTEEFDLVTEDDVIGFAEYEAGKYGELLTSNCYVYIVPDGFLLLYPETLDIAPYIGIYKSDLEEYITSLFAAVEEPVVEEIVEDLPVVEEVAPVEAETASFTLFGYTVENSWLDGVFTSTLKEKGIVTEDDVRGFALSEIEKYGEMLTANASISFVADGFTLTYPETVDPAEYIDAYKADLVAYITSLFASEEAPAVEEAPVEETVEETEEEMDIKTSDFDVFGYRILNSWYEGVFVSQTEEFGLVSEDDVIGFAEYEAEKYGELLTSNCYVYIVPDGFILLYPETLDIAPYIGIYKSDLEEYITSLFAAVEEPVVEEIVEEPPVVEEPKTEETVAVAPETEVTEKEEVKVPEPVGEILVSVVTDKARVETENAPEAVKKLSTFSVSTSLGAEFGFKTGREYVTVFPRLDIAGEFRNVFSFGPVEIGARFDIASVFRPLDGTFLGHDFSYFLVGDNWAMDGTVDAKLMFSISSSSLRGYAGIGIGYSIASNVDGITSHTEPKVFGFNSAVVATGVLGLEWRISDAFSLSLEGQARYFMETKEYAVGAALCMGWNF